MLCDQVPGGFAREISVGQAVNVLATVEPIGVAAVARKELAEELIGDLRRLDVQLRDLHKRLAAIVAASQTSTTGIFGVGPVVAAMVVGGTGDIARFATSDRFAAYTGTAPIEASSGPHKIYRLSRRGTRQLNHAIHIAAVTQIRNRHTDGRAYYDRKIAEGKSPKMALRALKRRISDALYKAMTADARRGTPQSADRNPRGQSGDDSVSSAADSHPEHQLFGQATPGLAANPNDMSPTAGRREPITTKHATRR